jgi:hypothetical protein
VDTKAWFSCWWCGREQRWQRGSVTLLCCLSQLLCSVLRHLQWYNKACHFLSSTRTWAKRADYGCTESVCTSACRHFEYPKGIGLPIHLVPISACQICSVLFTLCGRPLVILTWLYKRTVPKEAAPFLHFRVGWEKKAKFNNGRTDIWFPGEYYLLLSVNMNVFCICCLVWVFENVILAESSDFKGVG